MAEATTPTQRDGYQFFIEGDESQQSFERSMESQDHSIHTDNSKKRKHHHFEDQLREFTIVFCPQSAACNNTFTAGGKRNKSQDVKDCHGYQQEACVAPGNLHWPPILTPSNFSNAANVGYGERTDSELSDLHRETNSLRGIPTPVIGAIRNATSNSLPGLQALPVPPLYQCLSCGQLNPVVSFPRAENDEDVPYFLASSAGRNDPQGNELENLLTRKRGN